MSDHDLMTPGVPANHGGVTPEPLSFAQRRIWFLDQLHPSSAVYNLPAVYRIRGQLDADALIEAIRAAVDAHDALRTTFPLHQGVPVRIVRRVPAEPIDLIDLSGRRDAEAALSDVLRQQARRSFDLATGPLWRCQLVRLGREEHVLSLCVHHIVCDAHSLAVMAREISRHYRWYAGQGGEPRPPLLRFTDFVERQRTRLTPARCEPLFSYWRQHLAGIPLCIDLPTDRPRPSNQDHRGAALTHVLPDDVVAAVDRAARDLGATPFIILLGAFSLLLRCYSRDPDVVVGTPVGLRSDVDLGSLVGLLVDTLVLRVNTEGCGTFADVVAQVASEVGDGLSHADLPFDLLVETLKPAREPSHNPVFQVMFGYWDGASDHAWDLPGCEVLSGWSDAGTAKVDLSFSLTRTGSGISLRLEYASALYDESTVGRMAEQFVALLGAAAGDPGREIASLRIMPAAEAELVSRIWGQGGDRPPAIEPVHRLIAAQARRTPDATALIDEGNTLTYQDLDAAAMVLAQQLRRVGVGPGSVVGLYLDRTVQTVVALLGVLKAGAAYLPLDPGYPRDRLAFMVRDAAAEVIVTRVPFLAEAAGLGATALAIDDPAAPRGSDRPLAPGEAGLGDLAYMIYTSGSTGRPKGVRITHANLARFLAAMDETFGADPPGTWLAVTSISFDISVLELLWTLTRGYRVVIRRDEPTADSVAKDIDAAAPETRPIEVSLFFFGNATTDKAAAAEHYRMVLEAARFADQRGFRAIWTPERHFHPFGGMYPNPSVLSAALAVSTSQLAIRAGSVVLPLHDPLRVVEEWSLVDNLSGGRVGMAIASGWQPDDFVLAPERYHDRKAGAFSAIEQLRTLWRGGTISRQNGLGQTIEVSVHPRPVQLDLPIWITSARHPETFQAAGRIGAGLLTHLVGHSRDELAEKIGLYRDAWRRAGHQGDGHVTLMVHTFVGEDQAAVRETVRDPLKAYIRSSFDLMSGFGATFGVDVSTLPLRELEELLDLAVERFVESSGLIGTPASVADALDGFRGIGVDEVGCLIDFGPAPSQVLAALVPLAAARQEHVRRCRLSMPYARTFDPVAAQIERYKVTHLQCTPSLAGVLVSDPAARAALRGIRRFLVGGEALAPDLATLLAEAVGGSVHNMYGPTEATVWATTCRVSAGARTSIGRPLPGYRTYVVDAALNPVPIGVPGELLIGGDAVADGYHDRPELTQQRFVPDHLSERSGGRLYRTGDLVRWRVPGELEFLGRLDHQVKLYGRRLELGEIEATLARYPGIRQVVCDVRGAHEAMRLVAYCVPDDDGPPQIDITSLREFLRGTLPDYMVPGTFVQLDRLPLTPNGKIDRRALPDATPPTAPGPPRSQMALTELEQTIASVWQDVLNKPQIGIEQNFFAIGGNSILIMAVRTKLRERLGEDFSLVDLFRFPTVRAFASAIAARRGRDPSATTSLERVAQNAARRRSAWTGTRSTSQR